MQQNMSMQNISIENFPQILHSHLNIFSIICYAYKCRNKDKKTCTNIFMKSRL